MSFVARSLIVSLIALILAPSVPSLAGTPCVPPPPVVTGVNLTNTYSGAVNALQDNPTHFGDATPPTFDPSQGNELDRLFVTNDSTTLYIGISGNTNRTDVDQNTAIIFIDTGNNGGTNTLVTAGMTGSNALTAIDGVTLDCAPEYAISYWNSTSGQVVTQHAVLHNLTIPNDTGFILTENTHYAINNSNLDGVSAEPAHDPLQQEANAATAVNGFEFAIPIGPGGMLANVLNNSTIRLQVLLVGGGGGTPGFISNQSLPPLNRTVDNVGGGVLNVGKHDPNAVPPNIVDFNDNQRFPGDQNIQLTLAPGGSAPGGALDGAGITTGNYGAARATQNNYTGFGNAAVFAALPTSGSEIDQIFITNDASKLYIGVTGNVPAFDGNNNTLIIFLDVNIPGVGYNELQTANMTGGSGAVPAMSQLVGLDVHGVTFDPGFAPYWAIQYWRGNNQHNAIYQDLEFGVEYPLEFTINSNRHLLPSVQAYTADLSNILGVNSIAGDDPIRQEAFNNNAQTRAITGMQFSIRLSELGIDPQSLPYNIRAAAMIVAGSGFISNQMLPPMNETNPVPQTNSVSFSSAPLPMAIPDNSVMGTADTRTVVMANINRVTDVNVSVNITHPDISQVSVSLRHNDSGRVVVLKAAGTGAGANLVATYDSEGGGGTILPHESLLTFNGVNPNSAWTLTVADTAAGQTGTLNSWGLDVTQYSGGAVNCVGNYDFEDNAVNFGDNVRFPGNQYLTYTVQDSGGQSQPSSFAGQNIPSAFLPTTARSTQNNYTCFGDAITAQPTNLPGSEMDQMFLKNTTDRVQVAITGNLENNGNAFVLLLDTVPGTGMPTLTGLTAPSALGGMNNLTFDPGFAADYAVSVQRDATPSVPANDYNVFLKILTTNSSSTRTIGRLTRGTGTGLLAEAIPNQNGSELDQLFVQNDGDRLYIGLTGNLEANGNAFLIFIQTGAGAASGTLSSNHVGWPTPLRGVNNTQFDVGFKPNYAISVQRNGGNFSAQLVDLTDIPPGITVTTLTFSTTIGDNVFIGDNTNASGVNSNAAEDPTQQAVNAATAIRGVQFAIPRSAIGNPALGSSVLVSAGVTGSGGYWSNQILPPLGGGQQNLGVTFNGAAIFTDGTLCPGDQFATYTLADGSGGNPFSSPSDFSGSLVRDSMGPVRATQNNYTGFGNAAITNPGNDNCTQVALDDSNTQGVTDASAAGAATATSGMEFDLAMQDIGLTPLNQGGQLVTIKAFAILTGPSGYLSNQMLPGAGRQIVNAQGNPTDLGFIPANGLNLGDGNPTTGFPGVQYITHTLVLPCTDPEADINSDGVINASDVSAFVNVLLGLNTTNCDVLKSDQNGDATRNARDIQPFVGNFLNP